MKRRPEGWWFNSCRRSLLNSFQVTSHWPFTPASPLIALVLERVTLSVLIFLCSMLFFCCRQPDCALWVIGQHLRHSLLWSGPVSGPRKHQDLPSTGQDLHRAGLTILPTYSCFPARWFPLAAHCSRFHTESYELKLNLLPPGRWRNVRRRPLRGLHPVRHRSVHSFFGRGFRTCGNHSEALRPQRAQSSRSQHGPPPRRQVPPPRAEPAWRYHS